MSLFKKAKSTQAYLKAGLLGFAGAGKTVTASAMAIGLVKHMQKLNIDSGNKPVMFLDTETGADWLIPHFEEMGVEFYPFKTRAFADLADGIKEAEKDGSVLIIDSITHFWREFCAAYQMRKNRKYGLQLNDWMWLKEEWAKKFATPYVNSHLHIIMCGRAGFEFDMTENEDGKKELEKTGVKMKTEAETGFEPSLLVYMLRQQTQDNRVYRTARILKDRSLQIEGQDFQFPVSSDFTEIARGVFRVFKPHIDRLNLGGSHSGFDESRTSAGMIPPNEKNEYKARQQRREILIDEIKKLAEKHFGGQSQDMKRARDDLLEKHFNTRSWVKLEQSEEHYPNEFLRDGYDAMHTELEGMPAYGGPPNQEAA